MWLYYPVVRPCPPSRPAPPPTDPTELERSREQSTSRWSACGPAGESNSDTRTGTNGNSNGHGDPCAICCGSCRAGSRGRCASWTRWGCWSCSAGPRWRGRRRRGGAREPWMAWILAFHRLTAAALLIKRDDAARRPGAPGERGRVAQQARRAGAVQPGPPLVAELTRPPGWAAGPGGAARAGPALRRRTPARCPRRCFRPAAAGRRPCTDVAAARPGAGPGPGGAHRHRGRRRLGSGPYRAWPSGSRALAAPAGRRIGRAAGRAGGVPAPPAARATSSCCWG